MDELKPDTSDRRPTRPRKTSSVPKVPISRQHMMMGVGILVLLLLVIGIGSALKSSDSGNGQNAQQPQTPTANSSNEKSINLSGSSSMSEQAAPAEGLQAANGQNTSPQELNVPQISSTPTEAQPVQTPQNQQRVELPGDLNNALSNQQEQVDAVAEGAQEQDPTLPTAPATVTPGAAENSRAVAGKPLHTRQQEPTQQNKLATSHRAAASKPAVQGHKPAATTSYRAPASASKTSVVSTSTPGGNFTLQLSSASRSDTLNTWAKKQNLNGYHIYQTTRNGQPWYVLVSGSYATSADAKRAVSSLPAEVRAQNPWVKQVSQVKKEAGK